MRSPNIPLTFSIRSHLIFFPTQCTVDRASQNVGRLYSFYGGFVQRRLWGGQTWNCGRIAVRKEQSSPIRSEILQCKARLRLGCFCMRLKFVAVFLFLILVYFLVRCYLFAITWSSCCSTSPDDPILLRKLDESTQKSCLHQQICSRSFQLLVNCYVTNNCQTK